MQELVEAALDGYSVTVFAFGQTGSGKTHTIVGPRLSRAIDLTASGHGTASSSIAADPNDGLLPRCIQAAFDSIEQRKGEAEFSVTATCTELYNESVTDLLGKDSTKQLQVTLKPIYDETATHCAHDSSGRGSHANGSLW